MSDDDRMIRALEQLLGLLKNPEPGLATWTMYRNRVARELFDLLAEKLPDPAAPLPAMSQVADEVARATVKFPTWPTDPLHAVAVLGEEFGELTKAVLQSVYEPHKSSPDDVRTEAIQTAAMALRFLASLDAYEYQRGEQHEQEAKS